MDKFLPKEFEATGRKTADKRVVSVEWEQCSDGRSIVSVTLGGDCPLHMIKVGQGERFDGHVRFVLWDIEGGFGFVLGNESSVGDFGLRRAIVSEIDGFAVEIDGGITFLADFDFAILWRLVFDFGHDSGTIFGSWAIIGSLPNP